MAELPGSPLPSNQQELVIPIAGGEKLSENVMQWFRNRNGETLNGALAFVPWVLQESFFQDKLIEGEVVLHKGAGAVVFSDASGFTQLTERLTKTLNGAELLSQCLTLFFTPLVELLNDYHGDVIKFGGDALTVYFPDVDDTLSPLYNNIVPPHGTYGLPDLGPMATAVLRASACCIEIHKRLHMFDTGVEGVFLSLHIGIGCGEVQVLQVGGVIPPETHVPRYEYIIAGTPLEQISIAEPLAKIGETCLSPQAWEHVKECVIEGPILEDRPDFHLLARLDESRYTFPTVKHAAKQNDNRKAQQFTLKQLNIIRQYIPSAVFKQIECGTLTYVNEMRYISVIFISGNGLDVMTPNGPAQCQELVSQVQRSCYSHEGTLNKFLIDDKGMLFLLVFGLPPLVHTDDPTRAVLACFDMVKVYRRLGLIGRFGVTTSQSYCGVCGSARRMEYTVLGDHVNLASRLMMNAPAMGIYCDEETKERVTGEIVMNSLAPVKVKGKTGQIQIFQPVRKEQPTQIGVTLEGKVRYPTFDNPQGGGGRAASQINVKQLCSVKGWSGIERVQSMLGGTFSKQLHEPDTVIKKGSAKSPPPQDSVYSTGGVIVLESPTGMGKIELAEHMVIHAATQFNMLPIFGTMGPRPGDSNRLASELIRSTLSVVRFLNPAVSKDDITALQKFIPQSLHKTLPLIKLALTDQSTPEQNEEILDRSLDVVTGLLKSLIQQTSIQLVMQFECGTSLFPKTLEADQNTFWKASDKLSNFVQKENAGNNNKICMVFIVHEAKLDNHAVQVAQSSDTLLRLMGLSDESILEYMSSYIGDVPTQLVPAPLRQFVGKVTLGNPLYIRETVEELQSNQHIMLNRAANGQPRQLECKDLDKANIAAWQHTCMVGGTVCLLESLDPHEAAVLKMSTCFAGPFSLPDLAASTASKWADATYFDFLRLYQSLQKLVTKRCIEIVDAPPMGVTAAQGDKAFGKTQYFQTRNLLIRAIATAMVLEQQKKSVKRQALVDRVLSRELPPRMEVVSLKKKAQHIPWYYEQAFRRM